MAIERIDVEVTDKVDSTVETRLLAIADASDKAGTAVQRLKDQLAAVATGPVQQLKSAATSLTSILNAELNATTRLQQQTDKLSVSDAKATILKDRLAKSASGVAIAAAKEAAANSKAEEAASRAALAALRLADAEEASAAKKAKAASAAAALTAKLEAEASAARKAAEAIDAANNKQIRIVTGSVVPGSGANLGVQAGDRNAAAAATEVMRAGSSVGTSAKQTQAAVEQLETVTVSRFARIKNAALGAYDSTRDALAHWTGGFRKASDDVASSTDRITASSDKYAASAQKTKFQNANIIAQLQDIGVSLAGGQNPLLVMIQQGSQLSYIATTMDGGMKQLLGTIVRLLAPFTVLAAVVGGLYLGFKAFTADMASKHKPELENYAKSLGLTDREMQKLGNTTVGANGKLKEFDTVTITMGDSWNGFVATVKEGLAALVEPFTAHSEMFKTVWQGAMGFAVLAFKGFYASVMTLVKLVWNNLQNTGKIVLNAIIGIAEAGVMAIQGTINLVIGGLNLLIDAANKASEAMGKGKLFDNIKKVDLGVKSLGQNMFSLERFDIGKQFNEELGTVDRTLTAFGKRWDANSDKAARERLKKQADAIIANRVPKKPKKEADPKTQADYLDDENKKLDNQLSRMKMLKDAREEQQQLDQIEEAFAKRRMPLDKQQLDGFRARIHAIQEYKYQQAEMDRIYEAVQAPMRTYNAAVAAANDLLGRGAINQQQFNEEMNRASRAYKEATDPLMSMKEATDAAEAASKLYGDALETNNYQEQVRQALLAKGIDLTKNATAAQIAEAKALVDRNTALRGQQYVQNQVGEIVNPMIQQDKFKSSQQSFYEEIDRLRQADVISERQAQQAKAQLQTKYDAIRFQGATTFFENLSQLSSSKNAELAAIGKAAAVADATIKGYQAVQNALATVPYPFNIAAAAAMAAATGVQVANILSTSTNVGSFNNGGSFIVGGEHGIDQNTIAMNVSRGERVSIETPGQQRSNDGRGEGGRGDTNVKIINITDKKEVHDAMQSEDGVEVIMNIIGKNRKRVNKTLGNG